MSLGNRFLIFWYNVMVWKCQEPIIILLRHFSPWRWDYFAVLDIVILEDETNMLSEHVGELITILFGNVDPCRWVHYIVLKCWEPITIIGHLNPRRWDHYVVSDCQELTNWWCDIISQEEWKLQLHHCENLKIQYLVANVGIDARAVCIHIVFA